MLQRIGKYTNNILIILSLLFIVTFLTIFNFIPSLLHSYLNIEKISIEGSSISDDTLVKDIIREYSDKTLLYFPIEEYKFKLESLDWIKRVSIKRKFPDTIHISILENQPYAVFTGGKKQYLIDRDGEIICPFKEETKYLELLKVTGLNGNIYFPELIRNINIGYPEILNKVVEVEFIEQRRWNLILNRNLKIKLPEKNSSLQLEKLKKLQQDQKVFNTNILEIDLRAMGRATIKIPGGEELKTGLDEV